MKTEVHLRFLPIPSKSRDYLFQDLKRNLSDTQMLYSIRPALGRTRVMNVLNSKYKNANQFKSTTTATNSIEF